jgi:hypothetical protein
MFLIGFFSFQLWNICSLNSSVQVLKILLNCNLQFTTRYGVCSTARRLQTKEDLIVKGKLSIAGITVEAADGGSKKLTLSATGTQSVFQSIPPPLPGSFHMKG